MKRGMVILLVVFLLIPQVFAATCGDNLCEKFEEQTNSPIYCPRDCETGVEGNSCFSTAECNPGFECVKNSCTLKASKVGEIVSEKIGVISDEDIILSSELKGIEQSEEGEQLVLRCEPTSSFQRGEAGISHLNFDDTIVKIKGTLDTLEFIEGGPFVVYGDDGNNIPTESFKIKADSSSVKVSYKRLDGEETQVKNLDLTEYGQPIAGAVENSIILYTYDSSPPTFIIGEFLLVIDQGEVAACKLETVNECNDGIDNDGDGFTDYNGVCEAKDQNYLCVCDYDNDRQADDDEFIGQELCSEEYNYFCLDKSGNIAGSSCESIGGEYLYYDEYCEGPEGETEGENNCIDNNILNLVEDCLDFFPEELDPKTCLKNNVVDLTVWCEQEYGEGITSCTDSSECAENEICDVDYLSCIALEDKLAQENLQPCRSQSECSKGLVCQKNFCIPDIYSQGSITSDNPFLAPIRAAGVTSFVNTNDIEYQLKKIKQESINLAKIKKAAEEGKISPRKLKKLEEKGLKKAAKRTKKATEIISEKLTAPDLDESSNKLELTKLGGFAATVDKKVLEYIQENPDSISTSEDILEIISHLEDSRDTLQETGKISPKLVRNFAVTEIAGDEQKVQAAKEYIESRRTEKTEEEKIQEKLPPSVQHQIAEAVQEGQITIDEVKEKVTEQQEDLTQQERLQEAVKEGDITVDQAKKAAEQIQAKEEEETVQVSSERFTSTAQRKSRFAQVASSASNSEGTTNKFQRGTIERAKQVASNRLSDGTTSSGSSAKQTAQSKIQDAINSGQITEEQARRAIARRRAATGSVVQQAPERSRPGIFAFMFGG
jgi:hypothetical protein